MCSAFRAIMPFMQFSKSKQLMLAGDSIDRFSFNTTESPDALKQMRKIDDNIIYALNTAVPTSSFDSKCNATDQCKKLYEQLIHSYDERDVFIKKCIVITADKIKEVKTLKQSSSDVDNFAVLKSLRSEQTKLRLLQNELAVEEVVQDRSKKVYRERCRWAYKPSSMKF